MLEGIGGTVGIGRGLSLIGVPPAPVLEDF